MSTPRTITIVSACMKPDGTPTFAVNKIAVSEEEAENGVHFYLVEADLFQAGYEEPFVHFDAEESPDFLHPAVRQYLGLSPAEPQPHLVAQSEEG